MICKQYTSSKREKTKCVYDEKQSSKKLLATVQSKKKLKVQEMIEKNKFLE